MALNELESAPTCMKRGVFLGLVVNITKPVEGLNPLAYNYMAEALHGAIVNSLNCGVSRKVADATYRTIALLNEAAGGDKQAETAAIEAHNIMAGELSKWSSH